MFKDLTERYAILNKDKPSKKRINANIAAVRSRIEKEKSMNTTKNVKLHKYTLRIIAAAAAIVCLTGAVSAAGIADSLGAFRSFFVQRAEKRENIPGNSALDFDSAEITEYNSIFDAELYTVTVRGFMSDLHCIYVYYDITYNGETFFENGKLKDTFINETPIKIASEDLDRRMTGWGDSIGVHEDGKTVSYVGSFDGDFSSSVNAVTGNCEFKMTINCYADDQRSPENYLAGPFEMEVSVPVALAERYIECSLALELPTGKTSTLEGVLISPLSASLYYDNDYFFGSEAASFARPTEISFIMKNGEKVKFNGDGAVLDYAPTPEMLAATSETGEQECYPIAVFPDGSYTITEADDTGIPIIYRTSFAAVINPDEVAGIEIMGNIVMFG